MDEFEIFKARATGCEIHVEDSTEIIQRPSPRNSLRSEILSQEFRDSNRRKSLRKSTRRMPEDNKNGSLQVKVEIQPPSPVACRKLSSEQLRSSDGEALNISEDKYPSNGSAIHCMNFSSREHARKLSTEFKIVETHENLIRASPKVDPKRRSRHSFTTSNHRDDLMPSEEFEYSDKDEEQIFQRSKSCRNTSFNHGRNKQFLYHENSDRRSSDISHTNSYDSDDDNSVNKLPTVYRVRSFTTKKGEIVSRGDSFKVCGNKQQFLLVGGDHILPGQRRSSAAVAGGSYSRLEVCSLSPGTNQARRSSLTCLAANHLTPIPRRGSSECRRVSSSKINVVFDEKRKSSLTSGRESLPRETVNAQERVERWSNKSTTEADDVQCCVTDELHPQLPEVYHVSVLGSSEVGKTTLINQLMTSEYLANKEQNDQGDDDEEAVVSVVLDGLESTVHFHEGASHDDDNDYLIDAYLLVFSVTERNSLSFIQSCLHDILKHDKRFHQLSSQRKLPLKLRFNRQKPAIGDTPVSSDINNSKQQSEETKPPKPVLYLVGNKQDLVRNRIVSETDVKRLMEVKKNRCKYAEASALLDHKVDEVLVDIVREIRAKANMPDEEDSDVEDISGRGCLQQAMVGFCGKLFK